MQPVSEARLLSIIRMTSSPVSFIASTMMLFMVMNTSNKLTTTQNRLLAGLAISDMLSSLAMSFGPIPMPSDTPNVWMALGNDFTCDTQGFIIIYGFLMTPFYNTSLCIFYLLKIRYDISDETIRKKIEPFLHLVPVVIATVISTLLLLNEMINPTVSLCFFSDKPVNCTSNPDVPCERGEGVIRFWPTFTFGAIVFVLIPIVIISSMTTIYITVCRQEERLSQYGRGSLTLTDEQNRIDDHQRDSFLQTKKVMYRGLSYAGAWFIVFIFPFIIAVTFIMTEEDSTYSIKVLNAIFHPLQGLLNFLIFIYPKVARTVELQPELSILGAIFETIRHQW